MTVNFDLELAGEYKIVLLTLVAAELYRSVCFLGRILSLNSERLCYLVFEKRSEVVVLESASLVTLYSLSVGL